MAVQGSVDVISRTEVRGWAYALGRHDPVLVQAVLNHEIMGEAVADMHRPDLVAAGYGNGNSGYAIKLYRPIDLLYAPFLVVKVDGGDTELPRVARLGFNDFFGALYAHYPSAGRPRSVFGGLWTDRTDAAALLRSKAALGLVTPAAARLVSPLIREGFVLLPLSRPPQAHAWPHGLREQPGGLLQDPALLPLLQAVLEDNPVMVQADAQDGGIAQPSASNPSPSPAECLGIVAALDGDAVLEVVRDSHCLPEFTQGGVSRWASRAASDGVSVAGRHGLLDRYTLAAGSVAVMGPGTLHRARPAPGGPAAPAASVVQLLCLPARGVPLSMADLAHEGGLQASGAHAMV